MEEVFFSALRSYSAYKNPEDPGAPTDSIFISSWPIDTQVYFTRLCDTIYVTFRGTSSPKDFLSDLDIKRFKFKNGIIIHNGFWKQFKSVEPELVKNFDMHPDARKFVFAGHSLGGALAQIAAVYFGDLYKKYTVCHTFGSPRVGNDKFVEWFHQHVQENVRVQNSKDPVTMIPMMPVWKHTKRLNLTLYDDYTGKVKHDDTKWYKRLYKFLKSDLGDHSCQEYIDRLAPP